MSGSNSNEAIAVARCVIASSATTNCAAPIASASNSNHNRMLAANEREAVHPGGNAATAAILAIGERESSMVTIGYCLMLLR
jgi:hypothetical protein